MPQVGDFTISVIDPNTKTPLEEYKVTTTDNKTECYIESMAEKQFSVSIQLNGNTRFGSSAYALSLIVDGEFIISSLLGNVGGGFFSTREIKGAETGMREVRAFVFGNTKFTGT